MKKISIITPAYNAEKYIERCIKSVLNQTYSNIEHIIVDDGSTDKTAEICDLYQKKYESIKIIHKKNEGVSKARNTAILEAKGDFILFADADDWLEESMCKKLVESALKNESDVVICGYYDYYENSDSKVEIKLKEMNGVPFRNLISDDSNKYGGFPWNKLIRKDKITHYFDNSIHFYENLLFFLKNFDNNTKYSVVYEPLYNYCINDNSAVHSKKYNPKKITTLDALNMAIPYMNGNNKLNYMYIYVSSYYSICHEMKVNKVNTDIIKKYTSQKNEFYNLLKCQKISMGKKVKLFIMKNFPNFFFFIKKIKSR